MVCRDLGSPKFRGALLGVRIKRIFSVWGLHWGSPIYGNYHVDTGQRPQILFRGLPQLNKECKGYEALDVTPSLILTGWGQQPTQPNTKAIAVSAVLALAVRLAEVGLLHNVVLVVGWAVVPSLSRLTSCDVEGLSPSCQAVGASWI